MPVYEYYCSTCGYVFEECYKIEWRDYPTTLPCPRCVAGYTVSRRLTVPTIDVKEGACGNASTGYSSTHGDAENFKARQRGEPIPYPSDIGRKHRPV